MRHGSPRAPPPARGRLDRPPHPQHARLGREDRLGRRAAKAGQPAARAVRPGRRRPAVPRADERRILRRGPAPLRHRLLSRRRPRLLRPAGNLRPAESAADARQPLRRSEPGRRAPQPDVRTSRRDAVLALRDREERAAGLLEGDVPEEIDGPQRRQDGVRPGHAPRACGP